MPTPHFLVKDRHGGYLYRKVIPVDLRRFFSHQREIRRSLHTHHRPTALRLARRLAADFDELFEALLLMPDDKNDLRTLLAVKRATMRLEAEHGRRVEQLEEAIFQRNKLLVTQNRRSDEQAELARLQGIEQALNRLGSAREKQSPGAPSEALLPLVDTWITPQRKRGDLAESSETEYRSALAKFFDIVGSDITTAELRDELAERVVIELLDFPKNRWKAAATKNLSLAEARQATSKRISRSSASISMNVIIAFGNWLHDKKKISHNPFAGHSIDAKKKSQQVRHPFKLGDARRIFGHPWMRGERQPRESTLMRSWRYWLPVMALITGARIEELARLRRKDIRQDAQGWYLDIMPDELIRDIHGDTPRQSAGKSTSAHRYVPLHPALENLGFLDFVASRPGAEGSYIFVMDSGTRRRRSHKVSGYVNDMIRDVGIADSRLVFHSWRHSLRQILSRAGLELAVIKSLIGHDMGDDVTTETYGMPYRYDTEVTRPSYVRVDFSRFLVDVPKWGDVADRFDDTTMHKKRKR